MFTALKDFIQHNPTLVKAALILLIFIAAIFIVAQMFSSEPTATSNKIAGVWFVDLTTGQTFKVEPSNVPPIASPQGNPAVRAYHYQCAGSDEKFIGLYEKYTDAGKKQMEELREKLNNPDSLEEAYAMGSVLDEEKIKRLSVDGETWYSIDDPELEALITEKLTCPDGSIAQRVPGN